MVNYCLFKRVEIAVIAQAIIWGNLYLALAKSRYAFFIVNLFFISINFAAEFDHYVTIQMLGEKEKTLWCRVTETACARGSKTEKLRPMLRAYASSFVVPKTSGHSFRMLFQYAFA